ncbi:MAG: signal recognition particle-docking protein FtsY [Spirochaetia bacterium]|jgi:fused signal recognition particle receptor|nr:signal recognition particle-docking protein FtsY [Spirochaetales bacterium]
MRKFALGGKLRNLFGAVNVEFYDELEDILIEGDIGPVTAARIIESLRGEIRGTGKKDRDRLSGILKFQLGSTLRVEPLSLIENTTNLLLILGVNGVGKTTTIAKLANFFRRQQGKTVLLAAADTFRAAAVDQLVLWGKRIGVNVFRKDPGADPGAVVYEAISSAEANRTDLVIADTAGRMHNKAHLVRELGKINRIAGNRISGSAYKKILVLDATTGQNALRQAEVFQEAIGVDSIILAKYDSTAKGGIVVAISSDLGIPFSFMGVGEKVEDLVPFDRELYLNSLIGS